MAHLLAAARQRVVATKEPASIGRDWAETLLSEQLQEHRLRAPKLARTSLRGPSARGSRLSRASTPCSERARADGAHWRVEPDRRVQRAGRPLGRDPPIRLPSRTHREPLHGGPNRLADCGAGACALRSSPTLARVHRSCDVMRRKAHVGRTGCLLMRRLRRPQSRAVRDEWLSPYRRLGTYRRTRALCTAAAWRKLRQGVVGA